MLKDPLADFGWVLSVCDEMVIVSRCLYGSFSTFVQRVLERMMPYLLPFYGPGSSLCHKKRYGGSLKISACFYGENLSEEEKQEARKAVENLREELGGETGRISFVTDALAAGGLA